MQMEDNEEEELSNNLEQDIIEYNKRKRRIIIIVLVILCFIFRGSIIYWLKFGFPHVSEYNFRKINVLNPPIQINYTPEEQKQKTFVYTSLINNHKITIVPQAHYELSGMVVAYNHDFLFISDFFDSAALYDIGVTWGIIADKNFYKKYFKSYSDKNEVSGARTLHFSANSELPMPFESVKYLFSHSHLVPANNNVMGGLLKIRLWQNVKIDGDLINMDYDGKHYATSMSRTDDNPGDHGYGACETIYVTKVTIGKKVYK